MKNFFKKHGATVYFHAVILAMFVLGFVIGMYGRSAPDAETAEYYTITSEAPTPAPTESEAPQYTELTVTATAYCPCTKCSDNYGRMTATGVLAEAGRTIAVDPSVIPYGTKVIIDGHTYIAEDCGGAVKGLAVDIFFDTHDEANEFGRQELTAYIQN